MQVRRLRTGLALTEIGFGGAQLGNLPPALDDEVALRGARRGLGPRDPLLRHGPALRARAVRAPARGRRSPGARGRSSWCRPRWGGCLVPTPERAGGARPRVRRPGDARAGPRLQPRRRAAQPRGEHGAPRARPRRHRLRARPRRRLRRDRLPRGHPRAGRAAGAGRRRRGRRGHEPPGGPRRGDPADRPRPGDDRRPLHRARAAGADRAAAARAGAGRRLRRRERVQLRPAQPPAPLAGADVRPRARPARAARAG